MFRPIVGEARQHLSIALLLPARAGQDGGDAAILLAERCGALRAFDGDGDKAGDAAGGFFMPILHPFLTGRLARWRLVERWLEEIMASRAVWVARLEDIADHLDALSAQGHDIRTERLRYYRGPQT